MRQERYAIYLRKSRADDPGESIEEVLQKHMDLLTSFMKQTNIHVDPEDIYQEVVSGDSLYTRPQMLRLLEAVEQCKYAAVLCVDIQRLGRGSMSDQGMILDAFKESGTKIITPTKTYDLQNEVDETFTEFETFLGRQELRMIKGRLKRGKERTIHEGGYCANAPYGYKQVYINKKPTLQIVEEEAAFVRMMFDCYGNQGMGSGRIAEYVSSLGAVPRRGTSFARSTVLKILRNPVYIGKVIWNRNRFVPMGKHGGGKRVMIHRPKEEWTIVEGLHAPIIDRDLFEKVQARLKQRSHDPHFTGIVKNPLAGIVVCNHCGDHMQRLGCRGGPLLVCPHRGCNVSSRLVYIENAILNELRLELERLKAEPLSEDAEPADKTTEIKLSALRSELATVRGQMEQLHNLVEQGAYDIPTFVSRRDKLQERIREIENAEQRLIVSQKSPKQTKKMIAAIQRVLDLYPNAVPNDRNQLLKGVLEQVSYQKEKGAAPNEFQLEITLRPQE